MVVVADKFLRLSSFVNYGCTSMVAWYTCQIPLPTTTNMLHNINNEGVGRSCDPIYSPSSPYDISDDPGFSFLSSNFFLILGHRLL